MRHVFLPAILPTTLYDKWKLNPINWMDERTAGSPAHYPRVLVSYYHWRMAQFEFHPDDFIFGDSGGYSVVTLGAQISPREVLHWQIKNCSVGVILDVPPYVSVGSSVLGGSARSNWDEALRKTRENTRLALPVYESEVLEGSREFGWWGVVHGEAHFQMQEWFDAISEIYPFDGPEEGWALKPHPANRPPSVARCLRFVNSSGIRRAHFLQMTGIPAVTTLFCLGPEAGLDFATYDSASSSFSGINRTVFQLTGDGLEIRTSVEKNREKGETHARDWMVERCDCPSCDFMREDLDAFPEKINEEYYKYRMIYHNTLISRQVFANLKREAEAHPHELLKAKLGDLYPSVLRAFEGPAPHTVSLGTPKSLLDFV